MTTEATAKNAARAEILNTLRTNLATLRDVLASPAAEDTVLAWANGLTVLKSQWPGDKEPRWLAVRADHGTAFNENKAGDFAWPVAMNGHREVAKPIRRALVLIEQIQSVEEMIKMVEEA